MCASLSHMEKITVWMKYDTAPPSASLMLHAGVWLSLPKDLEIKLLSLNPTSPPSMARAPWLPSCVVSIRYHSSRILLILTLLPWLNQDGSFLGHWNKISWWWPGLSLPGLLEGFVILIQAQRTAPTTVSATPTTPIWLPAVDRLPVRPACLSHYHFKICVQGWRDDPVVKNIYCSCRGPMFSPGTDTVAHKHP